MSYKIDVVCTNCNKEFDQLEIVDGRRVGDVHCPNCGCQDLIKQ